MLRCLSGGAHQCGKARGAAAADASSRHSFYARSPQSIVVALLAVEVQVQLALPPSPSKVKTRVRESEVESGERETLLTAPPRPSFSLAATGGRDAIAGRPANDGRRRRHRRAAAAAGPLTILGEEDEGGGGAGHNWHLLRKTPKWRLRLRRHRRPLSLLLGTEATNPHSFACSRCN